MENNETYSWSQNQQPKKQANWKKISRSILAGAVVLVLLVGVLTCLRTLHGCLKKLNRWPEMIS